MKISERLRDTSKSLIAADYALRQVCDDLGADGHLVAVGVIEGFRFVLRAIEDGLQRQADLAERSGS